MPEGVLARARELKKELVRFGQSQRFGKEFQKQVRRVFGDPPVVKSEAEAVNFIDWFILEHVLSDRKTIVDKFVLERDDLSSTDKDMLLRWKEVIEGLYEVEEWKDDGLILRDLVTECQYLAKSNVGLRTMVEATPGSFLATRLVPMEGYWMLSGIAQHTSRDERKILYRLAYEYRMKNPLLVFKRNPAKLQQAWEWQAKLRAEFIAFFGSDLVVLKGALLSQKMTEFYYYRAYIKKGKDGMAPAERARQLYGECPALPEINFPPDLLRSDTVGIIYDEKEGINYYSNFARFQETFECPELVKGRRHRECILGYLKSPSISPLPFRRMAQMYPSNSESVLAAISGKPGFKLEKDFEKLMRRYKREWMEKPVYPHVMPVEPAMGQALWKVEAGESEQAPSLLPGIDKFLGRMERRFRKR